MLLLIQSPAYMSCTPLALAHGCSSCRLWAQDHLLCPSFWALASSLLWLLLLGQSLALSALCCPHLANALLHTLQAPSYMALNPPLQIQPVPLMLNLTITQTQASSFQIKCYPWSVSISSLQAIFTPSLSPSSSPRYLVSWSPCLSEAPSSAACRAGMSSLLQPLVL